MRYRRDWRFHPTVAAISHEVPDRQANAIMVPYPRG
jgi:hypothetical protein